MEPAAAMEVDEAAAAPAAPMEVDEAAAAPAEVFDDASVDAALEACARGQCA
eukprot:CAMPEP_0119283498 /NCGR_PEP_ID=MMETSP1329-20130426/28602_1 /TAXON_ID=114041 /ORGANISM="Genus nov. species nov., Strain RCC1024" /LENGTH=51 /DNA_ID=CAMNT_0007284171 /DNA_START=74 /DNA_END=226 /DNA_ORIENTATION=+